MHFHKKNSSRFVWAGVEAESVWSAPWWSNPPHFAEGAVFSERAHRSHVMPQLAAIEQPRRQMRRRPYRRVAEDI